MRNRQKTFLALASATFLLIANPCAAQKYKVAKVERTRILIDKQWDAQPDAEAAAFIAPYKNKVDSIMGPVVGTLSHDMTRHRPESELSNLLTDILVWGGRDFHEQPVFAVYNMGGIRSNLAKGKVTVGDVNDMAPFENKICFLTLTGEKVTELFQPQKQYRIATLDYLAEGNDQLVAFKSGTDVVAPKAKENNVRYIIMSYFREKMAKGESVESQVEGRVVVD